MYCVRRRFRPLSMQQPIQSLLSEPRTAQLRAHPTEILRKIRKMKANPFPINSNHLFQSLSSSTLASSAMLTSSASAITDSRDAKTDVSPRGSFSMASTVAFDPAPPIVPFCREFGSVVSYAKSVPLGFPRCSARAMSTAAPSLHTTHSDPSKPAPAHSGHLATLNSAPLYDTGGSEAHSEHGASAPSNIEDMLVFHDLTLGEVIQEKPSKKLLQIAETQMIYEAIKVMDDNKVGGLLVTDEGGTRITGIVTERDYLTKVALRGLNSRVTPVQAIMTSSVQFGSASQSASEALRLMTQNRFRHLPVVNDIGQLLGMVSIGDLVKTILSELSESVTYYKDYVNGKYRYSGSYADTHSSTPEITASEPIPPTATSKPVAFTTTTTTITSSSVRTSS